MDYKAHWQRIYATKSPEEVSWFLAAPTISARLLAAAGLRPFT